MTKRQYHRKGKAVRQTAADDNMLVQTTIACCITAAMRLLQAEPHHWSKAEATEFGVQLGPAALDVGYEFVQSGRAAAGKDGATAE